MKSKHILSVFFCLFLTISASGQCDCSTRNSFSTGIKLCDPVLVAESSQIENTIFDTYAGVGELSGNKVVVIVNRLKQGTPWELERSLIIDAADDFGSNPAVMIEQKVLFEGASTLVVGWYSLTDQHIKSLSEAEFVELTIGFEKKNSVIGEIDTETESGSFLRHLRCLK